MMERALDPFVCLSKCGIVACERRGRFDQAKRTKLPIQHKLLSDDSG